ncbi:cytochrome P450 [Longispora albida]|uniref:cytochrome P450 n=1 Tax=Longispora albida TaxID=203523 RepID=UPI00037E8BD5|nr:cytochrome P450 [Longispora albida]
MAGTWLPLAYRHAASCPFDPAQELLGLRALTAPTRQLAPNGEPVWLVVRHAEVRQVLSDRRFSTALTPPTVTRPHSTGRAAIASPTRQPGSLPGNDPPEHTRLRRMIGPAFSARRMAQLRTRVSRIVDGCLDTMERSGPPADLVVSYAQPVATLALCALIGVPAEDLDDFQHLAYRAFDRTLSGEELASAFTTMWDYTARLAASQREDPDDTVLGTLVRDHGGELTDRELIGLVNGLLIAGQDTSASTIALGTLLLLRHPPALAAVRDDPATVDNAVEEMLRYLSVVQTGLVRTATEDVLLGGQLIKAGEHVMMSMSTANRDESLYQDPDRFDITRDTEHHLGFGHGIHFCLGAALARHELRVAIPALLRRFPALRLATPFHEVEFRGFSSIYGLRSLPVTW